MNPDELKQRLLEVIHDYQAKRACTPSYITVGPDIFAILHSNAILTPGVVQSSGIKGTNPFWHFCGLPVKVSQKRLNYVEAMPRKKRLKKVPRQWKSEYLSMFTTPAVVFPKSMMSFITTA